MKRYERILLVSAIVMILSAFGITGALDTDMEVGILPIITFILSSLISAVMIYFQYLDNKED